MNKIKTLTVNGESYQLWDGDASHIDDSKPGADAWSSKNTVDKCCPSFTESGAVVACEPVEGYPLHVVSSINPLQEGSGNPGPDNIRPISGHTEVTIRHYNCKNHIDDTFFDANYWSMADNSANYKQYPIRNLIPGKRYTLSIDSAGGLVSPYFYLQRLTNGAWSSIALLWTGAGTDGYKTYSFTAQDADYRFWVNNIAVVPKIAYIQLEEGSVATEYEPHSGDKFTIDFGQEIYGGSLDWQSGVLTVSHGNISAYAGEVVPEGWISSTGQLSEGAQVVYPLNEPYTIQLTPQEILALSGGNTFWADSGEITVTGKADPTAVIEKLTNAILSLGGNV